METIWICVYRDTIEEHDENENLTEVLVTKEFFEQYFNERQKEYFGSMENFLNEYTADHTEDFYNYAIKHNAVIETENWQEELDIMKNIQVTNDIKWEVIKYFGYENYEDEKNFYMNEAQDDLFVFYYNCMQNGIDVCDADRYASLNTVLGYDVGLDNFRKLDGHLWSEEDYDLMDLVYDKNGKQVIEEAVNYLKLDINMNKWNNKDIKEYVYYV